MATTTADALLRKLRRLEANMICPNCETRAPQGVGFGNVCVKFKTFVCDLCKTSHQAISHRVKSITMSNWTMEEVNELTDKMSGGNAAAVHIWLGKAPPCGQRYPGGSRPKAGDRIEVFKQFVLDAYEYGKFRSDSPYVPSGDSLGSTHTTPVPSKTSSPAPVKRAVSDGSETSRGSNSSQFLKPPAAGSTVNRSSTGDYGSSIPPNSNMDPFQTSFPGSADPFGFPSSNKAHTVANAPLPKPKPKAAPAVEANLIDFTDSAPIATASSTKGHSASSLLDDFNSFGFGSSSSAATATPPPPLSSAASSMISNIQQRAAPSIQPPIAPQAPTMASFDPFGAELLTPNSHPSSGAASPLRYPPHPMTTSATIPQSHSTPNLSMGHYQTATTSGPWSGNASPVPNPPHNGSNSNNNILDLFSGLTYDSSTTTATRGNTTAMNGTTVAPSANQWNKPSPMMSSSSAISQMDVFGGMNNTSNSYSNSQANAGRWPATAPTPSYGSVGMGMGMGATAGYSSNAMRMMTGNQFQQQQQSVSGKNTNSSRTSNSDSFDFLQDAMRQQLPK